MRLAAGSATDTGRTRTANEDSILVIDGLYAVADGMGGHRGGAEASSSALDALAHALSDAIGSGLPTVQQLLTATLVANADVFSRSLDDRSLAGMGTTLVVLAPVLHDTQTALGIVNVGDSRIYVRADGELHQVSEDHSLVETMIRTGQISAEEGAVHPRRNVVTRALGIEPSVDADAWVISPRVGDRYLLCSDGLMNELTDPEISSVLGRLTDPSEAAFELVRLANEAGGRDNISVVIVDVLPDAAGAANPTSSGQVELGARLVRITEPSEEMIVRSADSEVVIAAPPPVDGWDPNTAAATAGAVAASGALGSGPADALTQPPTSKGSKQPKASKDGSTARRLTWRVVAFWLAVLAIVGGGLVATGLVARSGYFLDEADGVVVVFKGHRGGLLWFEPTLERTTEIRVADLRPSDAERLRTVTYADRTQLDGFLDSLAEFARQGAETTTTTSLTATTSAAPAPTTPIPEGP